MYVSLSYPTSLSLLDFFHHNVFYILQIPFYMRSFSLAHMNGPYIKSDDINKYKILTIYFKALKGLASILKILFKGKGK